MSSTDFSWHPERRIRYGMLALPVLSGLAFFWFGPEGRMERGVAWWFMTAPLLGMIEGTARVEPECRRLVRQWRLLGLIPVWTKKDDLDAFEAVTRRRCPNRKGPETEWVAMVRKSGGFVWIRYFQVNRLATGQAAKGAAERLSEVTGLPMADYPDRLFSKSVAA